MQINLASKGSSQNKVREPLVETSKRKNEMPDAVKVAIVRAGAFYICSDEVLKVLAPRVQYMEFAEIYSDREREERLTYGGKHTKKVRGETLKRFSGMIEKATDDEIVDFLRKGHLKIPYYKWGSEKVRKAAVKALVLATGKEAKGITQDDFTENGLAGLLGSYYRGSQYEALRDAGFNIKPWEIGKTPKLFYPERENRIAAIRWLVENLGKDARELTQDDFVEKGVGGLLNYYGGPYEALMDAGFEIKPWEMVCTPHGFWKEKENRVEAIRWLVAKLGKGPGEITQGDFNENGLGGLLGDYYRGCPFDALTDAGFELNGWEMAKASALFYQKRENRIAAIRWLVEKLGNEAMEITQGDFNENGLSGLLSHHYRNSPYEALLEAGFELKPWEMGMAPLGFWKEKENRIEAIRWLVAKLGKDVREIRFDDFRKNDLSGLLEIYYRNSPYEALKDAGLATEVDEAYMQTRGLRTMQGTGQAGE